MYLRRVKELREDSDTPQKVIAEYLGVKQNTYSDYVRGSGLWQHNTCFLLRVNKP